MTIQGLVDSIVFIEYILNFADHFLLCNDLLGELIYVLDVNEANFSHLIRDQETFRVVKHCSLQASDFLVIPVLV